MPASRSISRQLVDLASPIIGLNVLNVLSLAVDTAMCGRVPDAEIALTALGFAVQLIFLLLVGMMGLSIGSVALVSRAYGAQDHERVQHLLLQSSMLTILVSVAVAVFGNLLAPSLLRLLGARPEVVDVGLDYLRPLLTGTVFHYLTILYGSMLRGVGNTRVAFLVALFSNTLNVVANYGLILGNFGLPALGVEGAALGTLFSQAAGLVLLVVLLRRGVVPGLTLPLRPAPIDWGLAGRLFRIGAPASFDMVILNASFLSIIGMLGRIDQAAVAAHGIGLRIQALAFVPGLSVSQATGALVGQALGGRAPDRARAVVRSSVVLSSAMMSGLGVIFLTLSPWIVQIFDVRPDGPVGGLAIEWIRLLGFGMPLAGVHISLVGLLQGAGSTGSSLRINAVSTLLFQIPLSGLFGFGFGMDAFGVWLAFPLATGLKAALAWVAYRRGAWAKVGVEA